MERVQLSEKAAVDRPLKPTESTRHQCLHCGVAVTAGQDYCCSGCEAAHQVVTQNIQAKSLSQFADQDQTGVYKLTLGVSGVHCASCIAAIEGELNKDRSVQSARVNMSTERLSFTWDGARQHGDTLTEKIEAMGYALRPLDQAVLASKASKEEKRLLKSIAVSGFAAGNIMLFSVGLWTTSSEVMGMAVRDFMHWLSALIALPTVAYSGLPFFSSAWAVLRQGYTNMDVPISLAIILASGMSVFETINHGEHVYFDSAVMLLFFLLIGRYLDARARGKARQSAANLLSKLVGEARVIKPNGFEMLPLSKVKAGMKLLVQAGENFPADGKLLSDHASVDMSLITGESLPQTTGKGAAVYAGTTNMSGAAEMVVTEKTDKSLLSEIVTLMEVAEQGAARYVRLADKAAKLYTPAVHTLALVTFLFWVVLTATPWQVALLHAVTVLIITCPCALGLAVPVVQVLASGQLMRHGILMKSGDALEKMAEADTVIFDKTGTLTMGNLVLQSAPNDADIMQIAASMAARSAHPLSRALADHYDGDLLPLTVAEHAGKGLSAQWQGRDYRLGSGRWLNQSSDQDALGAELWLVSDQEKLGHFTFADDIRPDAGIIIQDLKNLGMDIHLLSGDRQAVVENVAGQLGINNFQGDIDPAGKCDVIDRLQDQGHKVLFVGDGLNDAPSLAAAYVSMSPSTAVDISQNAADVIFQGAMLSPVRTALLTARKSATLIKQNFALAILYNIIAVPFAMLGFVTPMFAAIAMSASSLVVISNSFRLRMDQAIKANK